MCVEISSCHPCAVVLRYREPRQQQPVFCFHAFPIKNKCSASTTCLEPTTEVRTRALQVGRPSIRQVVVDADIHRKVTSRCVTEVLRVCEASAKHEEKPSTCKCHDTFPGANTNSWRAKNFSLIQVLPTTLFCFLVAATNKHGT